jgi:parallel beta-helix repeat protein
VEQLSPVAFMTYTHADARFGDLVTFHERLSSEVHVHLGFEFPIFIDRKNIEWGQNWKQRIEESLDTSTFLIAILTPCFFSSDECRKELQRFLERERQLGRNDLVLPIYYVDTPQMNDASEREGDSLAQMIADRQHVDWRELRNKSFAAQEVRDRLTELAKQLRDTWRRSAKASKSAAGDTHGPQSAKPAVAMPESDIESKAEPAEGGQQANRDSTKTEPTTIVVDQMAGGGYVTISKAITAARPGTLIRVRPGHYREGLIIDKPLEIVGDGDRGDVIVEAIGADVALFKTTMGRIANLTLRQVGGGEWCAVDIVQGRLELEDCDITSRTLACIAIHAGADARIRRNLIHDGNQGGVMVFDNGQGTLEDNDIFGNALAGLEIREGGNPMVRQNRIHDNRGGVLVWVAGQGTLENNDIVANTSRGIEIREGGNPIVRGNRITGNGLEAIWIHDGGQGVIENNDLRGNTGGPWFISLDCLDKVTRSNNIEWERESVRYGIIPSKAFTTNAPIPIGIMYFQPMSIN